MTIDEAVKRIADYYGLESQSRQCMIECGRLISAVSEVASVDSKSYYRGVYDVAEEIAGVTIMMQQLMYLLDINMEQIEDIAHEKLERAINEINRKEMERKA